METTYYRRRTSQNDIAEGTEDVNALIGEDAQESPLVTPFGPVTPREEGGSLLQGAHLDKLPEPLRGQISGRLKLLSAKQLADNTELAQAMVDSLINYYRAVKALVDRRPVFFLSTFISIVMLYRSKCDVKGPFSITHFKRCHRTSTRPAATKGMSWT